MDLTQLTHGWQHIPERINPVLMALGGFEIRYYGLMFVFAIVVSYLLLMHRFKTEGFRHPKKTVEDFFIWIVVGGIVGGRLGYVLFYGLDYYLRNPLEIILPFRIQEGFHYTGISGMSYHGGLIGTLLGALLFCHKQRVSFWELVDFLIPAIPAGYTFGRLGNFLNGELFGRVTTVPWGMYFPADLMSQLRHPSQIYEAFFEGIVLFVLLWGLRKKSPFNGFLFSLYVIGYGLVRFFIEFTREPDPHLGFVLGSFTMGQILCAAMILAGAFLIVLLKSRKE